MGERNKTTQALILTMKASGENNRLVTYFSKEDGICQAMLFGGPKSKLKSLVQPFNSGTLYLYSDEIKKTTKINDFDVKNFQLDIRASLYKAMAANLACELVLKTKCAGDYQNAFTLLNAFLDGIDKSVEKEARLGTIRFLWRYIGLLGVQPDTHLCQDCAESLLSKEKDSFYIHSKNGFVCGECINHYTADNRIIPCDKYALTYLSAINELKPGQVRSLEVSATSAYQMKNLVFSLISQACGTKLNSLQDGQNIL